MKAEKTKVGLFHVDVTCWGEVVIYDTAERAEEWRKHKANWEQCIARMREFTTEEAREWLKAKSHRHLINGEGSIVDHLMLTPEPAP